MEKNPEINMIKIENSSIQELVVSIINADKQCIEAIKANDFDLLSNYLTEFLTIKKEIKKTNSNRFYTACRP